MPFQKGHKLSVGNKGGNRGSLKAEFQDMQWHQKVWEDGQNISALEEKIKSGKYAGRDMAALRLLKGDKTIIAKFMDKLVPTLVDVTSKGEKIVQQEEVMESLSALKKK